MLHQQVIVNGIQAINEGKLEGLDWENFARALLNHVSFVEGSLETIEGRIDDVIESQETGPLDGVKEAISKIRITKRS